MMKIKSTPDRCKPLLVIKRMHEKTLADLFIISKRLKGVFSEFVDIPTEYKNLVDNIKSVRPAIYEQLRGNIGVAEYVYYCIIREIIVRHMEKHSLNTPMTIEELEGDLFCLM